MERWLEEADAREVREMAALLGGERTAPTPILLERTTSLYALATTIRAMLPIRLRRSSFLLP